MELPDEQVKEITHGFTMNALACISDEINYQILKSEPMPTKKLMAGFELSRVAVDRRLNKLEQAGLVKRARRDENVPYEITALAKELVKAVEAVEAKAAEVLPEMLKGCTVRRLYAPAVEFK